MPATDTTRVFTLAARPTGMPDEDTFALEEEPIPDPGPGEALVRTLYLSVDPYMRGRMRDAESYAEPWAVGAPLRAEAVAEVIESNGAGLERGEYVIGELPWAEYAAVPGPLLEPIEQELGPLSAHLGVLGMPGRTAYFGVTEVAQPRAGETFVVTGAAGAVGSVAGQIAKLNGARVVGVAGSEEKIAFIEEELGFDAGLNYAGIEDYDAAFAEAAPEGVDAYFDNVGGPITDAVFRQLNTDARVAVCGQISLYNATEVPTGPRKLPTVLRTQATVQGFLVHQFDHRRETATRQLANWIDSAAIQYRETVTEGFERAPEAFIGLFTGENIGKQLVKVAEPDH